MSDGLLSLTEARAAVVAAVADPLPTEDVPVEQALGRVLAEDVEAARDVPPFANSAMDGYAMVAGPPGRALRVVDESRAGRPARHRVREGEAVRISTGAPLPAGATSVVPVEHAEEREGVVTPARAAEPHANVRDAGEDLRAGARVLEAGTSMGPAELGAAIAAGRDSVRCARRPRVALVATGDELVAPGGELRPGQIHDTNAVTLGALATRAGAEVVQRTRAGDDRDATEKALAAALETADLVVVSGGVSVGPHDHVRPALAALGAREVFWRVALKPGKPVWFGARGTTLVLGLPGNPVSAVVCFALFARPALRALQGTAPLPAPGWARLEAEVRRSPARDEAARVRLTPAPDGPPVAAVTGPQGSHMLSSLVGADGLAIVPAGEGSLPAGAVVEVEPL